MRSIYRRHKILLVVEQWKEIKFILAAVKTLIQQAQKVNTTLGNGPDLPVQYPDIRGTDGRLHLIQRGLKLLDVGLCAPRIADQFLQQKHVHQKHGD